jgi:hypothetical protein
MSGFPRIYRSFDEFEREELRKLDSMGATVDDLLEERFSDDLGAGSEDAPRRRRGRPRKDSY